MRNVLLGVLCLISLAQARQVIIISAQTELGPEIAEEAFGNFFQFAFPKLHDLRRSLFAPFASEPIDLFDEQPRFSRLFKTLMRRAASRPVRIESTVQQHPCSNDVATLCSDERSAGDLDGVLACLREKKQTAPAELSAGCLAELSSCPAFNCAPDVAKFCSNAQDVGSCLRANVASLSSECLSVVARKENAHEPTPIAQTETHIATVATVEPRVEVQPPVETSEVPKKEEAVVQTSVPATPAPAAVTTTPAVHSDNTQSNLLTRAAAFVRLSPALLLLCVAGFLISFTLLVFLCVCRCRKPRLAALPLLRFPRPGPAALTTVQ